MNEGLEMGRKAMLVQIVDGQWLTSNFTEENLIAAMEVRGYKHTGFTKVGGRLRFELQGAPTFAGISGPCFGGDACPLRYETPEVNELCSM